MMSVAVVITQAQLQVFKYQILHLQDDQDKMLYINYSKITQHKLTSLKVSPYVLLMYLRKAVVHRRVVTLSESE